MNRKKWVVNKLIMSIIYNDCVYGFIDDVINELNKIY